MNSSKEFLTVTRISKEFLGDIRIIMGPRDNIKIVVSYPNLK